eukprot:TRINITY_DN4367_c0_g1_i1.p1 TRINITY_DN4367_c0_g1~~TRINITY_DN4367_c0_g1_i1.p1  ORF type:complete len:724 (+),score=143.18 TRINITY_DN4367_c0_g1_i1:73-2244(+)
MKSFLFFAVLVAAAFADIYMHNPRGSNNRLNERSANRNNGNRMFDSQNNNRGGYNKGDIGTQAFDSNEEQYDFQYFMSHPDAMKTPYSEDAVGRSILHIEWTNQHGCGGNEHDDPHKVNCNMVLQYMCVPDGDYDDANTQRESRDCTGDCFVPRPDNTECTASDVAPCRRAYFPNQGRCRGAGNIWRPFVDGDNALFDDEYNCPSRSDEKTHLWPRDGLNTNRQNYNEGAEERTQAARGNQKANDLDDDRGLHESWEHYDECYRRERNRGLFTADQNLRNNAFGYSSAIFTRQNPNNNRRGYECPEERDYWPYWHPSPWVDIAVLTDRLDLCPFYQTESQNVKPKGACRNTAGCANCIRYNNRETCEAQGGRWAWDGPHGVAAPECILSPWSRVNHLGNSRDGQAAHYNWTLPFLATDGSLNAARGTPHRCVLRLRYNISTDDYDAWRVNSTFNNNDGAGIVSPVRQNPNVDIGAKNTALRLAINTAQFGRTFQDRSHVFRLVPRSSSETFFGTRTLYNLNVRGKRGNIVQTFPSVEYDFIPNHLHISEDDLVHIQWAGSNTHNNGNPAGDGQAGDAGEGRGGTDRHNFVQMVGNSFGASFPATWEQNTIFHNMTAALDAEVPSKSGDDHHKLSLADNSLSSEEVARNWALRMASAGYYTSYNNQGDTTSVMQRNTELNDLLNNAPASYAGGVFRFKRGTYDYMCTRNHNFSNRDQKGHLVVE